MREKRNGIVSPGSTGSAVKATVLYETSAHAGSRSARYMTGVSHHRGTNGNVGPADSPLLGGVVTTVRVYELIFSLNCVIIIFCLLNFSFNSAVIMTYKSVLGQIKNDLNQK